MAVLAASRERRLYRRARCEGHMDVTCPIAYQKVTTTGHALLVHVEERLSFEMIFYLRCLAEYELSLESRPGDLTLLQQASTAFWEGLSAGGDLTRGDVRNLLATALDMLGGGGEGGATKDTLAKRQGHTGQGKGVLSPPQMLVKTSFCVERVSVTLLLDPPVMGYGGGSRPLPIPFLGLVQDDIRAVMDVDMHTGSSWEDDKVLATVEITLQDMQLLELLPVSDNAVSTGGSVRSQAASAWSQFRTNRSRKIVSRCTKERVGDVIRVQNSSPFSPSKVSFLEESHGAGGETVLGPLLRVSVKTTSDSSKPIAISVMLNELEVFMSPSCTAWIDSLVIFATPPSHEPYRVDLVPVDSPSSSGSSRESHVPMGEMPPVDIKEALDGVVKSFDSFSVPFTLEACLMPLRIVVSDHIDGNDSLGGGDDRESVDSASLWAAGEGRAVLVIDTGRLNVTIGQKAKLSAHTESLIGGSPSIPSATIINFAEVVTSEMCVFLTEYTGPCAWRYVDRDMVDRGSLVSRNTVQMSLQVESKVLETVTGNDIYQVEMQATSLVSVSVLISDVQISISEGKLMKLIDLTDSFVAQSKGMGMEFDYSPSLVYGAGYSSNAATTPPPTRCLFQDTAVLNALEKSPSPVGEWDVFFDAISDDDEGVGKGDGFVMEGSEVKRDDAVAVGHDRGDVPTYDSSEDEEDDFHSVEDGEDDIDRGAMDTWGGDDISTINDIEVSASGLQDEIGELETERVALMANIRILELNKCKRKIELENAVAHLNRLDRKLKDLRSCYVGVMMEITAAKERTDQVETKRCKQKGTSLNASAIQPSVSYEQVAAFVRGLGTSTTQTRDYLEKERKRVRQMHQLRRLMVEFHAIRSSRRGTATTKWWSRAGYALLSCSLHVPNIILDITASSPRHAVVEHPLHGRSLAYGDEDIVMRTHIRDVNVSFTHRSTEAAIRTSVREILVINFTSQELNCRDLYVEDYYDDYVMKLSPAAPSTVAASPRGLRQPPSAIKCTYDISYAGNILRSPITPSTQDAHKLMTSISLLEMTLNQDLALRLCVLAENITSRVMATGAYLSATRNDSSTLPKRKKKQARPGHDTHSTENMLVQNNGLHLHDVADAVTLFIAHDVMCDAKFGGVKLTVPLAGSASVQLTVHPLSASLERVDDRILYSMRVASLSVYHVSEADGPSIFLIGKDFSTIQDILAISGHIRAVPPESITTTTHPPQRRPRLMCEGTVEVSSIAAVVSPITVMEVVNAVATGPLLAHVAQMQMGEQRSSGSSNTAGVSGVTSPHESGNALFEAGIRNNYGVEGTEEGDEETPETEQNKDSVLRPLDMLIGLLESSELSVTLKTGSVRVLLTAEDYVDDIMEYEICLGILAAEGTLQWGQRPVEEGAFDGMELLLLVKGIHGNYSSEAVFFLKPFDVSGAMAVLPESSHGSAAKKPPPQAILSDLPTPLLDTLMVNSINMASFVSPVRLLLDEVILQIIGRWSASKFTYYTAIVDASDRMARLFASTDKKTSTAEPSAPVPPPLEIAISSSGTVSEMSLVLGLRDIDGLSSAFPGGFSTRGAESTSETPRTSVPNIRTRSATGQSPQTPTNHTARFGHQLASSASDLSRSHLVAQEDTTAMHELCVFRCGDVAFTTSVAFAHVNGLDVAMPQQLPEVLSVLRVGMVSCHLSCDDDLSLPSTRAALLDCLLQCRYSAHNGQTHPVMQLTMELTADGKFDMATHVTGLAVVMNADIVVLLARLGGMYITSATDSFSRYRNRRIYEERWDMDSSTIPISALEQTVESSEPPPPAQVVGRSTPGVTQPPPPAANEDLVGEEEMCTVQAAVALTRDSFSLPAPLSAVSLRLHTSECGLWIPAGSSCRGLDRPTDLRGLFVGHDMEVTSWHNNVQWGGEEEAVAWTDDISPSNTVWFTDISISHFQCYESASMDADFDCYSHGAMLHRKYIIHPFSMQMSHAIYLSQTEAMSVDGGLCSNALNILQNVTLEVNNVHVSASLDYHCLLLIMNTSVVPLQHISKVLDASGTASRNKLDAPVGMLQVPLKDAKEGERDAPKRTTPASARPTHKTVATPTSCFHLMPLLIDLSKDISFCIRLQRLEVLVINDILASPMPLFRVIGPEVTANILFSRFLGTDYDTRNVGLPVYDHDLGPAWILPTDAVIDSPLESGASSPLEEPSNWVGLVGRSATAEIAWSDASVEYNNNQSLSWDEFVRASDGQLIVSAPLQGPENACIATFSDMSVKQCLHRGRNTPWPIRASSLQPMGCLPTSVDVALLVSKKVTVIVDRPLIEVISGMISALEQGSKPMAAYSLVNQTGIPICFRCHGRTDGTTVFTRDDYMTIVEPSQEMSIGVGLHHRSMSRYISLCAKFPLTDDRVLFCRDLYLSHPVCRIYSLYPDTAPEVFDTAKWGLPNVGMSNSVTLPVEISVLPTGLRRVLVRSTMQINNTYPYPLRLHFGLYAVSRRGGDGGSDFTCLHSCVLRCNDTYHVPVSLCALVDLHVRVQPAVTDESLLGFYSDFVDISVPSIESTTGKGAHGTIMSRNRQVRQNDVIVKVLRSDAWRILGRDEYHNGKCHHPFFSAGEEDGVERGTYSHWMRFPRSKVDSLNASNATEEWRHVHVSVDTYGRSTGGTTEHETAYRPGQFMLRQITLAPPITFLNSLPYRIDVLMYQGKPSRSTSHQSNTGDISKLLQSTNRAIVVSIASGERMPIVNFHSAEGVSYCIRIFSSSLAPPCNTTTTSLDAVTPWTNMMYVDGCSTYYNDDMEDMGTMSVTSGNGAQLVVQTQMQGRHGMRSIDVWVPFWIVSYSSHALHYQHHPKHDDDVLNGRDGLCPDQCVVGPIDGPAMGGVEVAALEQMSSAYNRDDVLSFAGEEMRSYGAGSGLSGMEGWGEEDRVGGKPYQLMICGYSTTNSTDNGEGCEAHLRMRVEEFPWSSSIMLSSTKSASSGTVNLTAKSSSKNAGRSTASKLFGSIDPFGTPLVSDQITNFVMTKKSMTGPFQKTTLVVVMDQFVAINLMGQPIRIKQFGCNNTYELGDGDEVSLSWRIDKDQLLQIRLAAHDWQWSGRISTKARCSSTILLRQKREEEAVFLVECSTVACSGCTYFIFRAANIVAPYRIENRTNTAIRFHQMDCPDRITTLRPFHACSYAWEEPTLHRQLVLEKNRSTPTPDKVGSSDWLPLGKYDFEIPKDATSKTTTVCTSSTSTSAAVEIRVDESGPTRVLCVVDIGLLRVSSSRLRSRGAMPSPPPPSPVTAPFLDRTDTRPNEGPLARPLAINVQVSLARVGLEVLQPLTDRLPLLAAHVDGIVTSISLTTEGSLVSVTNTLNDVRVVGYLDSHSECTMLGRSHGTSVDVEPYMTLAVDVNTKYPSGIISIPKASVQCAPITLHIDERMVSRLSLLQHLNTGNSTATNETWPPYKQEKDYFRDKKILSRGFVRHNLHNVHHNLHFGHLEELTPPSLAEEVVVKTLLGTKLRHVSPSVPPKLFLTNLEVSSVVCDITLNPILLTSLPHRETSDPSAPKGLRSVLKKMAFALLALVRVLSHSVLKMGTISLRLDAITVAKYFGDAEEFGHVIGDRYIQGMLQQAQKFITSPTSVVTALARLARFSAACMVSTAGNVALVGQSVLLATGAVDMSTPMSTTSPRIEDAPDPSHSYARLPAASSEERQNEQPPSTSSTALVTKQSRQATPKSLLEGLYAALLGLYQDPISGARAGGMPGLLKGLLRSWLGIAVKPCYGVLHRIHRVAASSVAVLYPSYALHRLVGEVMRKLEYNPLNMSLSSPTITLREAQKSPQLIFYRKCLMSNAEVTLAVTSDRLMIVRDADGWDTSSEHTDTDLSYIRFCDFVEARCSSVLGMGRVPLGWDPAGPGGVAMDQMSTGRVIHPSTSTRTLRLKDMGGVGGEVGGQSCDVEISYVPHYAAQPLHDHAEVVFYTRKDLTGLLTILSAQWKVKCARK